MTISDQAKARVAAVLLPGEVAVDATLGNGWDTLFLAELVGEQGKVFGFDVQTEAVAKTEKRLRNADLLARCQLLQEGHQKMADHVPGGVGAVMFNLGYLPYGRREMVTSGDTTLPALESAVNLLRVGGLLTVICYRGHPGGPQEAAQVWSWAQGLDGRMILVEPAEMPAGEGPFLITLKKPGTTQGD
jgi:predicted methyltransferase